MSASVSSPRSTSTESWPVTGTSASGSSPRQMQVQNVAVNGIEAGNFEVVQATSQQLQLQGGWNALWFESCGKWWKQ